MVYVKMVSLPSVSLKTNCSPALIILLAPSLETSFFKCCPWQVNFRAIKTAEELKTIKKSWSEVSYFSSIIVHILSYS